MSIVVLGGLASMLFLNALVIPAIYLRFGFGHERAVVAPDSEPVPSN